MDSVHQPDFTLDETDRQDRRSASQRHTVGSGIRRERIRQGLTLGQLADPVRLSVSALSQIERGANDPSLAALGRIADALRVPMFQFFLEPEPPSIVVRRAERRRITYSDGPAAYVLVSPQIARSFEVVTCDVGPGEATTDGLSNHKSEEFVLVLEGRLTITVGGDTYNLDEGDTILISPNVRHMIQNVGSQAARLLAVLSPPS